MTCATVYTVGHSTRSLEDFLALLDAHGIQLVVDVRRFPVSRRHPYFARDALERALTVQGIAYAHEPDLGGRRSARPDSPNTAWRAAGFRGYADHMGTDRFRAALGRLAATARAGRAAILCAEAVPWRCHRQLISDALVTLGFAVVHLLGPGQTERHVLHHAAHLRPDGVLVYAVPPEPQTRLFEDENR